LRFVIKIKKRGEFIVIYLKLYEELLKRKRVCFLFKDNSKVKREVLDIRNFDSQGEFTLYLEDKIDEFIGIFNEDLSFIDLSNYFALEKFFKNDKK
jgi:hypothetical protein